MNVLAMNCAHLSVREREGKRKLRVKWGRIEWRWWTQNVGTMKAVNGTKWLSNNKNYFSAIVSNSESGNDSKLQPTSPTIKEATDNDSSANHAQKARSQSSRKSSLTNSSNSRQVFVLSGRRRKKSKTYLIGNDPFDISRGNCIAKLKSNVLGTQFTAIR